MVLLTIRFSFSRYGKIVVESKDRSGYENESFTYGGLAFGEDVRRT